jgi:hypothetical protein
MSTLETPLDTAPYYDDYDAAKQYYRILFVPKRQVQVRELNQIQSLMQEQVRRFGDHVFKDGSIVDGCNITHIPKLQYVRVDNIYNNDTANVAFDESLVNFLAVSPTTGVRASIRLIKPGYELQYPDTNTLYVEYIKTGRDVANNEVSSFQSSESIDLYVGTQDKFANTLDSNKVYNSINVLTSNVSANVASTGITYGVTVGEGVIYQKGFFVKVLPHTITVRDYDTNVQDQLVGFNTAESIVTYLQDSSLREPATVGARNAIGADRLKLIPRLVSLSRTSVTDNDDFFPIIQFNETSPVSQRTDPEYAALGDVMGTHIFEPHGDFYTKPFTVGTSSSANTELFNYVVNPGIGYVKGNRVELIGSINLPVGRATATEEGNASIITLNYGNYVVVDEALGLFDFKNTGIVSIYNAPQNSVSEMEGAGVAPSGTLIGTANVRAFLYDNGVKGTSGAQYRLYLTNIKMNSGYSFATDAKSFYVNGAFGVAKADIVLVNSRAQILDSSKSSLVFPIGIEGLRRLRDADGNNDTTYYVRDVVSGTLQSNGSVTYTLNTPHAGGIERFFSSPGTISNTNELRLDVTFPTAALTSAKAGSVNATTTGNTLVGTGTAFTTDYKIGQMAQIRNGSNNFIRTVVSIANNTQLELDAPIVSANTAAQHRRYFPAGHILDLSDNAVVTVNSNTQFTVALSSTTFETGAPQTTYASYPVLRAQAVETKKTVKKSRYVKIDCTSNVAGPWNVGFTDVFAIESVWVGSTYAESNPERKDWFMLDNGQNDSFYDHAKIVIKPGYKDKISSATRILVKLSYFESDNTTGIGFYSVDSYPAREPGETANTTNISFADIPIFNGISLRDSVDFRPRKYNTANDSTTIAGATINPAVSNASFVVSGSGTYQAEPDTNFQTDLEFYLPRKDIIQVNKDGVFTVKSSVASLNARTPVGDIDSMIIANSVVPAYPSLTSNESYGSNRSKIQTNLAGNRNYTERDVGVLDQRITRLEYYQTLSALEQQAKDYNVKDENGLDRFKNGIFADPFNNHSLGNVSNFEYGIAIDERVGVARPKIKRNTIDLKVGSATNVVAQGQVAKLPYVSKLLIEQPYASKYRNATESVWKWSGNVTLFPSYDFAQDETRLPDVNVVIDTASPWQDFADSPFGTQYGDWTSASQILSSSTNSSSTSSTRNTGSTSTTTTNTTTTTTDLVETTNSRSVTNMQVGTSTSTYDLGTYVTDITMNPFMRSREVAFIATSLKPNSRFWVYFDETPVSQYCAPGTPSNLFDPNTGTATITEGRESDVITRTAVWGTQLVSDSGGNLYGMFKIPDGIFKVGDRKFVLANVDSLTAGDDAMLSSAAVVYTASSMSVTKKSATISVIEPKVSVNIGSEVNVQVATKTTSKTATNTTITRTVESRESNPSRINNRSNDPLGQSFLTTTPDGNVPGMFLDKIDIFFKAKDPTLGVTLYICEMQAGFPDTSKIIDSSYLKPSEVNISDDGTAETTFNFPNIPYLTSEKFYSFFIMPDGNSPEYLVWMAEVGGQDIATGFKIFSNPYIGTAFLSSNTESWTILQTEDVKFKLYRCQFTSLTGTMSLVDQDDDYFTVDGFSISNTSTTIEVGDVVYTQNTTGGVLTSNSSPFGVVQFVDISSDKLILDGSRGGFTANTVLQIHRPINTYNAAQITSNTLIATATIESVDNVPYSVVVPRIGTVTPSGTSIEFRYKGSDNSETFDSNFVPIQAEYEQEFIDKMRTIKSKSNRIAIDYSAEFEVTFRSTSDYLTPAVDLRRKTGLFVENLINNDVTNEHTRYGNALTKYLSLNITLADGQDAEDIKVFVTGYRPVGTDIHCYTKIWNAEDSDNFDNKLWTKLDMTEGASTFSSSLNTNDFREFGYGFPSVEGIQGQAYKNPTTGIVEYRNSTGSIYSSYKSFAIKLVLTSDRNELVPRLDDVRSIALQS